VRFEAEQPNECWQADFTHYSLADGTGTEVLTWLDDHSRLALRVSAHRRVTGPIVLAAFRAAVAATAPRPQPASLSQLQALLDTFTSAYNHRRPARRAAG
jgi:transposase InsO family protein